jgi:protein gp37
MTKIEWTEKTWNPIVGCSVVSPGCTNCYAMKMAYRLEAMAPSDVSTGNPHMLHYVGTTQESRGGPVWTGRIKQAPLNIQRQPLERKKPTTWFVNSMGDLFHEFADEDWIASVFLVMAQCPQHTFQVLTKRSERMRFLLNDSEFVDGLRSSLQIIDDPDQQPLEWPLPNVWIGVSAENQEQADLRIPDLLATPAAVRFVSAEPLLGPVDFSRFTPRDRFYNAVCEHCGYVGSTEYWFESRNVDDADVVCSRCNKISIAEEVGQLDWIIVGGESGPGARPMHPDWARSIRDQCQAAQVPFFFKQWGAWPR